MKKTPSLKKRAIAGITPLLAIAFLLPGCETYDYDDDYMDEVYDDDDDDVEVVAYRYGQSVARLPFGYRKVIVDDDVYYYHNGTYFTPRGNAYVVVNRPFRTVSYNYGDYYDELPRRYQTVKFGHRTFYTADGRFYRMRGGRYVTVQDPFYY
ncbi:MAG: hypothetical protein HKN23_17680 [Verrucomicrobiales bacterium]|nr:hypothetical protein [Verrucomicrobiales bacterium]